MKSPLLPILALTAGLLMRGQDRNIPHLEKRGAATQLILDGHPFLSLGAELHNSSSSSLEYMKPIWPRLRQAGLNTVLTPLSWELIEPAERQYDFHLVDGLIEQARENDLHIVLLWLASWKNGMSSYAPVWVKRDTQRFPRAIAGGQEVEILSTFGDATMRADARAFAALMRHIHDIDANHTVLMVQVENEVGVLGDTRDHSMAAEKAFASNVPSGLMTYLEQHRDDLFPDLRDLWDSNGRKTSGTWEQIFGPSTRTDEIFMAWNYGRYVNQVAHAGKAEYALPMYVNTWLARPNATPGEYPSGGPQPRVVDIWKAAGSAIDIYSPDIYASNFEDWCNWYNRAGNPLFIPEASGGAISGANVFYAMGQHAAIGFSPFAIDSWLDQSKDLAQSYRVLNEIAPLLLTEQAKGSTAGFLLDKTHPTASFVLDGYLIEVSLDSIFGSQTETGFGLVMATGGNEFLGAGKGFRAKFTPRSRVLPRAGIGYVEQGEFSNGKWIAGRRLNGDENDQGKYWRFSPQRLSIEKCLVYRSE